MYSSCVCVGAEKGLVQRKTPGIYNTSTCKIVSHSKVLVLMRSFFKWLPVVEIILVIINLAVAAPGNDTTSFVKRAGGFSSSCDDTSLNGWTLEALCQITSGSAIRSSLDLTQCLGWGAGGYLLCEPGE
jgi:hypothetical protein